MKKILSLLMIFTVVAVANPVHAQKKAPWQEMETFHEVMSKTFHPAEEGKLDPIRKRSGEMLEKAIVWKNSTPPAGYDKNAVLKNLKELVKGAKGLNKMVKKNASDKELTDELSKLHDVFHEIMDKCEGGHH